MNTLIRIDTTCFFQCHVHIICWVGVWKSWVLWNTKFIMYSLNYLYMFYLLLIKKALQKYTIKFNDAAMVLGHFIIYEILTEESWLKKRKYRSGATEFFTYGKKETKHIKIFSKFPNGFLSIWWGPSPPLWSLF